MADIGAFLAAKRLGAPTWVWGIGVVAIGAYVYLRYRSNKAAAATTSTGAAAGTTAGVTNPTGYPVSQDFTTTTYNTNPPPVQSTSPNVPGPLNLIEMGQYVVKGTDTSYAGGQPNAQGSVQDVWPDGIAQIVYNLDPNDKANHASDAILITLANPTLIPPYPVGTVVNYPVNGPQGWVPAPQTTSTTSANNTPVNSASGQ